MRWSRLDWAALSVVTAGAGAVRLAGLHRPVDFVFDEIFYAQNACRYVVGTAECGIEGLASRAHPPLGNWMVGLGIELFGYDAFGWRVISALAGTLTVALLYLLVRRLVGDAPPVAGTVGAFAAAGLLATDLLHLVMSRTGMLDAFVTLWVLAAVLFAVLDRDRHRTAAWDPKPEGWLGRLALGRPWRLAAGMALGAAAAVKWSGAYVALGIAVLIIGWEVVARRRPDDPAAPLRSWRTAARRAIREELPRSTVLLVLVPLLVYLASYIGRMPGELIGLPWEPGTVWRGIWEHQADMLGFHTSLSGSHPYESPSWSWLLVKRPVAFFFEADGGAYRHILALGNPLIWWLGAVALLGLGVAWLRTGAGIRRAEPVLLAAALGSYLPWLALSGDRTQTFIWYLLPAIPFLCAALGLLATLAWRSIAGRVAGAALAIAVLASFAYFFPVVTALPLTPDEWRARMWLTDCDRPGAPTLHLPDAEIDSGPPPTGWCWI